MFDDAAWDIYYAKDHIFTNLPFQAAFFDKVGLISREVVFHYYISIFFKLFGYNLLVFNISLLLLGFITVFFTTFLIHQLFKNKLVTCLSALIINFFPLHYLQIFMGHRYAIATPLMMISLFFLYTAFINKSLFRATISSLFAALCWDSAIMGKQFLAGLALTLITTIIFGKKQWRSQENLAITSIWITSFLITATPLLIYILFHNSEYSLRENGLIQDFYSALQTPHLIGIKPYVNKLSELFFAKFTYTRLFLPDFPLIPISYYLLLIPGLIIALIKRRFELIFLSFIPIIAAFVTTPYDYRVLLAAPIWVICMALTLNTFLTLTISQSKLITSKILGVVVPSLIILFGLIPSITYIWHVSKNPNYIHYLPHKDVAVSRLLQDIVINNPHPTINLKPDEFNRKVDLSQVPYEVLACPKAAYAIGHLYLQNYDDKKILSFCDQGIQQLETPDEITTDNIEAVTKYQPTTKDLKLIWEVSDLSNQSINFFKKYRKYGSDQAISNSIDDNPFSLYILTIKNDNIKQFQQEITTDKPTLQNI